MSAQADKVVPPGWHGARMDETTITTEYEPCTAFEPEGESPVCAGCGWLDVDHDGEQLAA